MTFNLKQFLLILRMYQQLCNSVYNSYLLKQNFAECSNNNNDDIFKTFLVRFWQKLPKDICGKIVYVSIPKRAEESKNTFLESSFCGAFRGLPWIKRCPLCVSGGWHSIADSTTV